MEYRINKDEMGSLSTFKSMLEVEEDDWYVTGNGISQNHSNEMRDITFSPTLADPDSLLLHPLDSSSSCSPSSSVFNNLDPSQVHYFLPPKPTLSSLLNVVSTNPLDHAFDLGCEIEFLDTQPSNASNILNRGGMVLNGFTDLSSNNRMSYINLVIFYQWLYIIGVTVINQNCGLTVLYPICISCPHPLLTPDQRRKGGNRAIQRARLWAKV